MDRDLMVIAGEIERLKEFALKMEKELFVPVNEEDIKFEKIGEWAEEADDCVNNLMNECLD